MNIVQRSQAISCCGSLDVDRSVDARELLVAGKSDVAIAVADAHSSLQVVERHNKPEVEAACVRRQRRRHIANYA